MKKEFKPISMKCSQKEFDEALPILKKHGFTIENIDRFTKYPYLVNDRYGEEKKVTNYSGHRDYHENLFDAWNLNTFLEYSGIELNVNLSTTTIQIL